MKTFLILCFLVLHLKNSIAQSRSQNTYCNPVDINYRYNFEQQNEKISYRAGADPVIVNHNGEYYLFVTISGGWWHSKDLLHWDFVTPNMWPMQDICAAAALSVRDTLFLFQSTFDRVPLFYTTTPQNGQLHFYNREMPFLSGALGPWDPDIFHDDSTDRWYMYFGSSNLYPVYGIELDHSNHLSYKGRPKELIYLHPEIHGWERFGRDHRDTIRPYIEGAWMTQYKNKYYLQYAAPGTEYNVYANGTYVGDSAMGPFHYAPYNPVSYKPGGFVIGAGHGNTFRDNYGNYWNTGTCWVAVNWNFERRIDMFPAGFNSDGDMYSNTCFGDFPHYLPTKKWTSKDELFTGWMLLSYKKPCTASSVRDTFIANKVTDENAKTYWVAKTNKPGEWITVDLLHVDSVKAIQVNFTDYKNNIYDPNDTSVYTQFRLYSSADGKTWKKITDLTNEKRDHSNAYIQPDTFIMARYIKYEHVHTGGPNLAISDIRIFGNAPGKKPATPANFSVMRDSDPRNAFVKWDKVPGAVGYNIMWGIGKEKLYETYQVFADHDNSLEVRALNSGQDYYFAIEAFDEKGVSKQGEALHCK